MKMRSSVMPSSITVMMDIPRLGVMCERYTAHLQGGMLLTWGIIAGL